MIRRSCATIYCSPTGNSTPPCRRIALHPPITLRAPHAFHLLIHFSLRGPLRPRSRNPLNRNDAEAAEMMKKILVSLSALTAMLLPCEATFAYGHANSYGGSTSHSEGSTSHSNPYGGSTSASAGQGASHSNAYGGSTSANGEGSASHTNTSGGSTSATYGEGATHTNTYGGTTSAAYGQGAYHTSTSGTTAYASAYHPPTPYYPP